MSRSNPQKVFKRSITDRKAKMGFGKFANEVVQDVLDNEPEYFLYLDAETDIEIACDILTEAQGPTRHEFSEWTKRPTDFKT